MRNLKLFATILFVAVLLVGVVILLRPTSTQNDTSVTTTTQVTNQQLAANTVTNTDPPTKGTLKSMKFDVKQLRSQSSSVRSNTVVKRTHQANGKLGASLKDIKRGEKVKRAVKNPNEKLILKGMNDLKKQTSPSKRGVSKSDIINKQNN